MIQVYIFLIPVICVALWALYTKFQQKKMIDFLLLLLSLVATSVNVCVVYQMMLSDISVPLHLTQMAVGSSVVPLLYHYFSRQVGRQTPNHATIVLLWVIAAFTFVPQVIFYGPSETLQIPAEGLKPYVVYYLSDGAAVFSKNTGDIAVTLQSIVVFVRIVGLVFILRRHNLHLNGKVYSFLSCWFVTIVFIVMVSTMSHDDLCSPWGSWFYFTSMAALVVFMSTLIARGYDLCPIETEQGEVVDDVAVYLRQQYSSNAAKLRRMMEEEQLFLDTQLTADKVISMLGTNHTYFSQMMSSEWRMSFSEYLNSLRLSHVRKLLSDDSLTISMAAQQSGFADAGYMSRKFKEKYGVTPSEWRKTR
ncbi:MAG: helix-turn-helix transcriptional regulator [Prevotella sp.]|nr:helix-turn-helix transcriptional regulator [Candidatus Prevotella equi]